MGKDLSKAFILAVITVVYNIAEGLISVLYGISDGTLVLFGFGADSFVEVISGIGILHMIWRMRYAKVVEQDKFEKTALRITGFAFYLLTVGLVIGAGLNAYQGAKPETTFVGIIISTVSIATMFFLMKAKLKVGKALNSDAVIADANCTRTCFYLSFILLLSSGLYELFEIGYIDILGSFGVAYFAFSEGREAFQKVKTGNLACSCGADCETAPSVSESI